MRFSKKLLSLSVALCVVFSLAACNGNNTNSATSSADLTPGVNISTENSKTVTYKSDDGVISETITVAFVDDTIIGISSVYTEKSDSYDEATIKNMDDTNDQMYSAFNEKEFASYKRANANGTYSVVLAFKDLHIQENADFLAEKRIYGGYSSGISIVTFNNWVLSVGLKRIDDTGIVIPAIEYKKPEGELKSETVSLTIDGTTDIITVHYAEDTIVKIDQTMRFATDSKNVTALNSTYDETFTPFVNVYTCFSYKYSYSNGMYSLSMSFKDLYKEECVAEFTTIGSFSNYIIGMRASEFIDSLNFWGYK